MCYRKCNKPYVAMYHACTDAHRIFYDARVQNKYFNASILIILYTY